MPTTLGKGRDHTPCAQLTGRPGAMREFFTDKILDGAERACKSIPKPAWPRVGKRGRRQPKPTVMSNEYERNVPNVYYCTRRVKLDRQGAPVFLQSSRELDYELMFLENDQEIDQIFFRTDPNDSDGIKRQCAVAYQQRGGQQASLSGVMPSPHTHKSCNHADASRA